MKKNITIAAFAILSCMQSSHAVTAFIYEPAYVNPADAVGISDTGVVLSDSFQAMTSYTNLQAYSSGGTTNLYQTSSGGSGFPITMPVNFYISSTIAGSSSAEQAMVRYNENLSRSQSPSGRAGANLLFQRNTALAAGDSFSVRLVFPNGVAPGYLETGNIPSLIGDGGYTLVGQMETGESTSPFSIAGRTSTGLSAGSAGISSANQTVSITGVLFDGSTPDFSTPQVALTDGGLISSAAGNDLTFSWRNQAQSSAIGDLIAGGNDTLVFNNNGAVTTGVGGGLSDFSNYAWKEMTVTWTAGDDGLADNTIYRLSFNGAPYDVLDTVPEPSSIISISMAGIVGLCLRRRKVQ